MKHDRCLVVGFKLSLLSTGIPQENVFTRIHFFIIAFFIVLLNITLSDPYHPLSLIDDARCRRHSKEIVAGAAGQRPERRFAPMICN